MSDVRPDGRMRLDAIARVLQDAARNGHSAGVWLLRKLALDIPHTPKYDAALDVRTWISGTGPRWAERRTDVFVGDLHVIAARAVWVHVERETGALLPLPSDVKALNVPRVDARLSHARPRGDAPRHPWNVRATDIDVMRHVNNAAYWAPAEEELARRGRPRVTRAEIEFGAGVDEGEAVELVISDNPEGFACWWCVGGVVRASILVACSP